VQPARGVRDLAGIRVLVVHEWLYAWAGAERCLEEILRILPQADLLVGIVAPGMRDHNDVTRKARESWVGRIPGARRRHRWFLPAHALAFAMEDTAEYDLVISSSHALEKCVRTRGRTKHLCYCYSPPRFLWDLREAHAERATVAERLALALAAAPLRAIDRRGAAGVDRFVSISRHIAARVKRCYGADSEVVYPPVVAKEVPAGAATDGGSSAPYLVYVGRLVEYKRVDLVVRAAARLGMRLVIAGEGPERPRLERIAGPHTEFVGEVPEATAARLLEGCAAFVFAGEEDFGIALVEANAHGRPVVCLARGGALETMVPDVTATFFPRQDVEEIVRAIERCLSATWDREALIANARRFSPERFRAGFIEQAALTIG
jgi:glycosyltransferase involved in cell wall biosynthesis